MVPGGWGELVLWDPVTGDQESVPMPDAMWDNRFQGKHPTAAIVCAAAGCDHGGCHGRRPFQLVMVCCDTVGHQNRYLGKEDLEWVTWACSYSSETGEWGDVGWIQDSAMDFRLHTASVLVGDSLLYFISDRGTIIEYDLAEEDATIVSAPLEFTGSASVALVLAEDGGLGVAESSADSLLNIWSRVVSDDSGVALWVKNRVICLDNVLPAAALGGEAWWPMSFAERANTLFIRTCGGIFTIELQSERVRKVRQDDEEYDDSCSWVPIEGFYIPWASQGEEGEYTNTDFIGSSSLLYG
jgi:hypothetical protein